MGASVSQRETLSEYEERDLEVINPGSRSKMSEMSPRQPLLLGHVRRGAWYVGLPLVSIFHQPIRIGVTRLMFLGVCQGGVDPFGRHTTHITHRTKVMHITLSSSHVFTISFLLDRCC